MADLKQSFILREVQRYLKECIAAQQVLIRRKNVGVTDDLVNSFASRARKDGAGAVGELIFHEYGRMVDMGVSRSHPLGGLAQTKVALKYSQTKGTAFIKDRARKPKKFYSPTVYGRLIYLQNRLLYGYSEEARKELIKELGGQP